MRRNAPQRYPADVGPYLAHADRIGEWGAGCPSAVLLDDHAQHRIYLIGPAPPVEHTVMPGARLEMVVLQMGSQAAAQFLRRRGLADGADVVVLAFHREQRRAPDRGRIDRAVMPFQLALGQRMFLKDGADGLDEELGR